MFPCRARVGFPRGSGNRARGTISGRPAEPGDAQNDSGMGSQSKTGRAGPGGKGPRPEAPAPGTATPGWGEAKGPALRFVLIAGGLMLLFYGVFYTAPEDSPRLNAFIRGYLGVYASVASHVWSWFGVDAQAQGPTLFVGKKAVEVARGCDAMEPIALYTAAMLAVQIPLRSRLLGLALGLPILVFANLLRILALSWIGLKYPEYFETAHVTVGQTVFVLFTLCLWFAWVIRSSRAETGARGVAVD